MLRLCVFTTSRPIPHFINEPNKSFHALTASKDEDATIIADLDSVELQESMTPSPEAIEEHFTHMDLP